MKSLFERFWDKVSISDGCWVWTANKQSGGYGMFSIRHGDQRLAHRVAWELAHNKPIPACMYVLHRCDNVACVRASHLFLGSQSDNLRDAVSKGRHDPSAGEKSGNAKLTNEEAKALRLAKGSNRALARERGVSHTTISNARRGKSYREAL